MRTSPGRNIHFRESHPALAKDSFFKICALDLHETIVIYLTCQWSRHVPLPLSSILFPFSCCSMCSPLYIIPLPFPRPFSSIVFPSPSPSNQTKQPSNKMKRPMSPTCSLTSIFYCLPFFLLFHVLFPLKQPPSLSTRFLFTCLPFLFLA